MNYAKSFPLSDELRIIYYPENGCADLQIVDSEHPKELLQLFNFEAKELIKLKQILNILPIN